MARKAIYEEITEWLRAEANRRGSKALMPTIAEVCEKFNVGGVQTVRNAYAPLLEEGVVVRLGKPRRWAVADNGQERAGAPNAGPILDEIERSVARVQELVNELRLTQYA
jgi:DNA-binding GntR family transcriptional regulator